MDARTSVYIYVVYSADFIRIFLLLALFNRLASRLYILSMCDGLFFSFRHIQHVRTTISNDKNFKSQVGLAANAHTAGKITKIIIKMKVNTHSLFK